MLSMIDKRQAIGLALAALTGGTFLAVAHAEWGLRPGDALLPAVTATGEIAADLPDAGNLVINGSFECRRDGQPPSHIETLAPGQADLAAWEIIDPSPLPAPRDERGKLESADRASGWTIDWLGPTRWHSAHSKHCLDLDGGIRQTIQTEPGKSYELRFDLAANPELGPNTVHLRVLIDDERHDFTCDSTGHDTGDLGWSTKSITFKATRKATTLTFYNSQPNSQSAGVALDHVRVADSQQKAERYRVTETSAGPVLLDTVTGQSWRLAVQDGQNIWLPIPREKEDKAAR